jgi:hypothetical protein
MIMLPGSTGFTGTAPGEVITISTTTTIHLIRSSPVTVIHLTITGIIPDFGSIFTSVVRGTIRSFMGMGQDSRITGMAMAMGIRMDTIDGAGSTPITTPTPDIMAA